MRPVPLRPLAAALAVLIGSSASAKVTFYDILKNAQYTQISAAQPQNAVSWDFIARIFTDVDNEVTAGTLSFPGNLRTLTPVGPRLVRYAQFGFPTEPDLENAYPATTYFFNATAGSLAGQSGSAPEFIPVRATEVPYLTGNSFADLGNATAGQSVTVTWNPYTVPAPVTHQLVYFQLFENGVLKRDVAGQNGAFTSYTIDGGDLVAGNSYRWSLFFDPRFQGNNGGFGGTASFVESFDSITSGTFSVRPVPEPASLAALGLGALAVVRRRRRA